MNRKTKKRLKYLAKLFGNDKELYIANFNEYASMIGLSTRNQLHKIENFDVMIFIWDKYYRLFPTDKNDNSKIDLETMVNRICEKDIKLGNRVKRLYDIRIGKHK